MSREVPTAAQLDAVRANADTMLWWQGCAAVTGATAEIMIAMIPLEAAGEYQPMVWARPDGMNPADLSHLLRQLAEEIDAGRYQAEVPPPAKETTAKDMPPGWAGNLKCCPLCGDQHAPNQPCEDF